MMIDYRMIALKDQGLDDDRLQDDSIDRLQDDSIDRLQDDSIDRLQDDSITPELMN